MNDYFHKLPTELLVDIFEHFDYYTLNTKVRAVCHRFNDIIVSDTTGKLGKILIQDRVVNDAPLPQWFLKHCEGPEVDENKAGEREFCFELHPCLRKLQVNYSKMYLRPISIDDCGFLTSTGDLFPLALTKVANENAFLSEGITLEERLADRTNDAPFLLYRSWTAGEKLTGLWLMMTVAQMVDLAIVR